MVGEETRTAAISEGAENGREVVAVDVTAEAKSSARAGPSRTAAKMTVGGAMKLGPVVFGPPHRVMALELRTAILNGDTSKAQTILEHNPARHVTRLMDTHRGTAAHFIIRNGCGEEGTEGERLDLLRILDSAAGAQVDWNATDSSGRTPLHLACSPMRNYVGIADFLLEHGADPNLLDKTGCSPLHDAAAEGMTDLVKILLRDTRTDPGLPGNSSRTALHKAAYRGQFEVVNLLLSRSPETVDPRDASGLTPLHDASRQNKYEVAERLILDGADVDARTRTGATPLHLAARNNAWDVAYLLMRADALITLDNAKETPEKAAQRKGHTAMVELLQSPVKVSTYYLAAGIQRLRMPQPTESQQATSRSFYGLVWPSMDAETTLKHDNATLFDLLYQKEAILGQSRDSGNVRWIHVPSNNVRLLHRASISTLQVPPWLRHIDCTENMDRGMVGTFCFFVSAPLADIEEWQDVFRVLFSSAEPSENEKQKAVGFQAPTLEQAKNATLLRAALKMCNTDFADMNSASLHRTPHFKAGYPTSHSLHLMADPPNT
jgi:ankyrin repeat protein